MRVVAVLSHGRLRLLVAVLFVRLCVVVVVVVGCFRWVRGDVWCFLFPVCGEGWDLYLCRCRGRRRRRHLRLIRGRCLHELMHWRRGWRLHEELGDGVLRPMGATPFKIVRRPITCGARLVSGPGRRKTCPGVLLGSSGRQKMCAGVLLASSGRRKMCPGMPLEQNTDAIRESVIEVETKPAFRHQKLFCPLGGGVFVGIGVVIVKSASGGLYSRC